MFVMSPCVAAFSCELLDDLVRYRIDPGDWEIEGGHPDRALSDRDVTLFRPFGKPDK